MDLSRLEEKCEPGRELLEVIWLEWGPGGQLLVWMKWLKVQFGGATFSCEKTTVVYAGLDYFQRFVSSQDVSHLLLLQHAGAPQGHIRGTGPPQVLCWLDLRPEDPVTSSKSFVSPSEPQPSVT